MNRMNGMTMIRHIVLPALSRAYCITNTLHRRSLTLQISSQHPGLTKENNNNHRHHSDLTTSQCKKPSGLGFQTDHLPTSAYVHIPFCKKRCFYCDFAIYAVGDQSNEAKASHTDSIMNSYVDSVCSEIASTLTKWPQVSPLKTLFFGGGTPSLLPGRFLRRILETFEKHCGFEDKVEVSMEMDPGTFTRDSLSEFLDCGINRISLGVQAFDDELLKACGRSHSLQDVYDAIAMVKDFGVKNWSVDLISSLPHQTLRHWKESLQKVVDAGPAHVSVYDLQIEEGTKFGTWYKPGQHPLPDDESSAAFYRLASSYLSEGGYDHYEISNYAKPGFQCMHNLVYWKNQPYYAFGLGATSYVDGHRFSRPRNWKAYANYVKEIDANISDEYGDHAVESVEDKLCDTIMLSLRLGSGLEISLISECFGDELSLSICKAMLPFIQSGHAIAFNANGVALPTDSICKILSERPSDLTKGISFIRLADPDGFLMSNEIISSVFSSLPNK